jgi:malto-oligosyltrehalose trehalohydrolase
LCLFDRGQTAVPTGPRVPLQKQDAGWFEIVTKEAGPGTQYMFRINGEQEVPDPASRFQPRDVHGPSEVVDPSDFDWQDWSWRGRRWEDAVIYELHVGTFTPAGTFGSIRERMDYLADLGVTAIELMPIADFPGKRNWGYDGVFQFAPDSAYGCPEDLKAMIQSAHEHEIMVFLDVVYNHFGPEGNYLNGYAPQFFTARHHTPWGNGINFDGTESRPVRDYFVHNALYWLNEYNFDGLRLDAVHAIVDDSRPNFLTELAERVRSAAGLERQVHLILENDRNQASYLDRDSLCNPKTYTAQWNDDIHHALHVLITGERDGYYCDYSEHALEQLARSLAEGFAYQGEPSPHRDGALRGESTKGIPPTAFVSFLQNHDQIGNRAFGNRISTLAEAAAVRAAAAVLLLAPSPPMLFMGEEFGAETPFLFFCDFEKELAAAVTAGRRNEFVRFGAFRDEHERDRIPDPSAATTFAASRLDWNELASTFHRQSLNFYRHLIALRREYIVPRLSAACQIESNYELHGESGISVRWTFPDHARLTVQANLGPTEMSGFPAPASPAFFQTDNLTAENMMRGAMPAWSVVWFLAQ